MSGKINNNRDSPSGAIVRQTTADPDQKPIFPRSLSFNDNDPPSGPSNLKSPFATKPNRIKKEQQSRRRSNSGLTNKDAYKAKIPNPRPKSIIRDSRASNKSSSLYSDDSEDLDEVDPRPRSSSHQVVSSPPSAPSSSEEKGAMVDIFPQISMGLQQKYLELKSDMSQLEEKNKAYEAELDLLQNSKTINQLSDLRSQMESVLFSSDFFANSAPSSLTKNPPRFGSLKNTYRPITPSFFRPPSSSADSRPQSPTPYLPGRITQNLLVDLQNITEMGSKLVVEVLELKSKAENEVSKRSRTEAKLHQIEDKLVHFSALEEKLRQNQEDLWKECQVNEKHSAKRHELESHVNVLFNHEKAYKSKIEANNEEIERLRLDIQALKDANLEIQSKFDLESANHRKSIVSSARESRLLQEKIRTLEKEMNDFHKVKTLTLVHETLNSSAPLRSPLPSPVPETSDRNKLPMTTEDPAEAALPPLNYNSEVLDEKNSRLVKTLTRSDAAKKRYKKKVDEQQKLLEQCRIKIQQLMEGAVSQGPSEDEGWELDITKICQISGSDDDSSSELDKSSGIKLLPFTEPILNSSVDGTKSNFFNSGTGHFSGSDSSQGKSIRRSRMPHRRQVSHSPAPSGKEESMDDLQSQLLENSCPSRKATRKHRRSSSSSSNASSVNRPSAAKTFATELLLNQSLEVSSDSAITKIAQIVAHGFSTRSLDYNSSPISPIPKSLASGAPTLDSDVPKLSEAEVNVIAQNIIKELRKPQSSNSVSVNMALDYSSSPIPEKIASFPDKMKSLESGSALNSSLLFSNLNLTKDFCEPQTTIDSKPTSSLGLASSNVSTHNTNVKIDELDNKASRIPEDIQMAGKRPNNSDIQANQNEIHTNTKKSPAISAADQLKEPLPETSQPSLLVDSTQSNDQLSSHHNTNIVPLVSLMIENLTSESRSQLHQVLQLLRDEPTLYAGDSADSNIKQFDVPIQTYNLHNLAFSNESPLIKRNTFGVDVGVQCSLQKGTSVNGLTLMQSDKKSGHVLRTMKNDNDLEPSSSRTYEESSGSVNPITMTNSVKKELEPSDPQCEASSLLNNNSDPPVSNEDLHFVASLSSENLHNESNTVKCLRLESRQSFTPTKHDMPSTRKEKSLSHSSSTVSSLGLTCFQDIPETIDSNNNPETESTSGMFPVCSPKDPSFPLENVDLSHNELAHTSTFESKSSPLSTNYSTVPTEEKNRSCASSPNISTQVEVSAKETVEVASSTPIVQSSDRVYCTPSSLEFKATKLDLHPIDQCHAIKCLDTVEENMAKLNLVSDSLNNNQLNVSLSQLRQIIQASQQKSDLKGEPICPTLLLTPETPQADNVVFSDQLSVDDLSERNISNQASYEITNEDSLDVKTRPSSRRSFSSQLSYFFQNSSLNKSFGMSRVGPVLHREGSTSTYRKAGQDSDGSVKDLVASLPSTSLTVSPNTHTPVDHIVLSMVHAMSGEFLHKFVRKTTFSTETVHLRFFWLNPYTRVLAWARREPHFALGTRSPRQVYVTKVEEIESSYRHPTMSEDCTRAINIHTTSRVITVKANSMAYHEMWLTALGHVQSHNTQQSSKYSRERHWNSIKSKENSFIMGNDVRSVKTSLLSRPSSRTGSYSSARRDVPEEIIRSVSPIYNHPEEISGADLVSIRVSKEFVRAPKSSTSFNESQSRPTSPQSSLKNHQPYGSLFSKVSNNNPPAADSKS